MDRARRIIRGRDLLEEIWHERDDAQIESLRENIKRLAILERSAKTAAEQLRKAGLDKDAKEAETKASRFHHRLETLREQKKRLELHVISEQARYYREGHS